MTTLSSNGAEIMIHTRNDQPRVASVSRLFVSLVVFAAILSNVCPSGAQQPQSTARLSEDQRILHVLNRLGFGARPGDVERIKAMGLDNYINQQLTPEKISDAIADARVRDLPTLSMSTAELYEKYPQPGQLLRQLQRRGDLPKELAEAQKNRTKAAGAVQGAQPQLADEAMMPAEIKAKNESAARNESVGKGDPKALVARDNEAYRRAIREYYLQNGLQLPQRITIELQTSRILRAVYSERQLQEVMVDFWTNHFNVFAGKGADRWLLVSYDRDTIRPNAMGKFSDLLQATAQSPAMLFYLDNFQSVSPNAQPPGGNRPRAQRGPLAQLLMGDRGNNRLQVRMSNNPEQQRPQQARRGINENYARELMELHTLGVDGGYTQKDVQEVARCFTGWTIFAPRGAGAATQAILNGPRADMLRENAGKFYFNPRAHDDGEKIVLGHKIPARGGFKDGLMVLDILAHSPATAKYIATKLVRHFVSDNPPPALVDRAAAAFTKSDGDIRETLRVIFYSPQFRSPEAYRAKVKRPFELAISAIRTLGAETNGGPQLQQWIARMGEPLYGFQTPNGYSDTAESWVNTGGLLERLNFGLTLASNHIPGTRVALKRFLGNAAAEQSLDQAQIMDRFLTLIVAGDITSKTKETLLKQFSEQMAKLVPAPLSGNAGVNNSTAVGMMGAQGQQRQQRRQLAGGEADIADPITRIVGLILGSPEFQRQ
ncbi:MAG TPA: DUF1800 domain-containing protein [Pyrinomonadaceae bacterium]